MRVCLVRRSSHEGSFEKDRERERERETEWVIESEKSHERSKPMQSSCFPQAELLHSASSM